jgi:hypothetical protein
LVELESTALRGVVRRRSLRQDDFHLQSHQLRRKPVETVRAAVGRSFLQHEILAFDIAQIAHSLRPCGIPAGFQEHLAGIEVEQSETADFRLLGERAKWHH